MSTGEREFFVEAVDGTRLYTRSRPRSPVADSASSTPAESALPHQSIADHGSEVMAVLCDGLCCDGFIYKYLWDDLARWCPVTHFHYRGHGRSELPRDPERIGVPAMADDLLRVVDALAPPGVILVGHSMGTQVALEAYRKRPESVRALVLMCGSFGRVTHTIKRTDLLATVLPDMIDWVARHPRLARGLWARVPVNAAVKIAGLIGDINVRAVRIDDVAPYFHHVVHVDFEMFLRMLRLAGEHSAEDLLAHVQVPTLVIAGARDTITPPELSRVMQETIPGARLCLIPEGTHMAPLEHRQLVRQAIEQLLNESAVLRAGRNASKTSGDGVT